MKKGYLYILLTTLLFSTMEIALKTVANQFNPIQLTFIRFLIGAIILVPLAQRSLKAKGISLNWDDYKFFLLTGFICVVVSMTFYQLSIVYCKASIVAILFSCNPVFVVPLAYYLLNEKVDKSTILSMVISIGGIAFILNPFHAAGNGSVRGILFAILAAITFALYGVMGKKRSDKYGGIVLTCYTFLMGCFEMFILILLSRIGFVSAFLTGAGLTAFASIPIIQGIAVPDLVSLVYISVFVTGLGYTFYLLAMEETSAITASVVFFIKPALAPVLAFIILHESIAPNTMIGMILIIAGSCITFLSNRRGEPEPVEQ